MLKMMMKTAYSLLGSTALQRQLAFAAMFGATIARHIETWQQSSQSLVYGFIHGGGDHYAGQSVTKTK